MATKITLEKSFLNFPQNTIDIRFQKIFLKHCVVFAATNTKIWAIVFFSKSLTVKIALVTLKCFGFFYDNNVNRIFDKIHVRQ